MKIQSFTFNAFAENTYILYDDTREAVIVDPGCYEKYEEEELANFIEEKELHVVRLINTHCHIDHVLGNYFVKEKYKVPFIMHKEDEPLLKAIPTYAPSYGMTRYNEVLPDEFFEESDVLEFGESKLEILHLPGHSPGHVALVDHSGHNCISGDVLFLSSIGRTDLPGGDHDTLINSIQQKLFKLPDDFTVYSGHGPTTTIGFERTTNPFCRVTS